MDLNDHCPRCRSDRVVPGRLATEPISFYPSGIRLLSLLRATGLVTDGSLGSPGFGCAFCGLAWSEVDAQQLKRIVVNGGSEKMRAWSDELDLAE